MKDLWLSNPQTTEQRQEKAMKVGVLLAQIGTPDQPTAKALRPYLREFLSDRRVIDYPPILWQPLLRGLILRVRPVKSARLYARIWTEEGSPLLVHSKAQVDALQERLGSQYHVLLGMTYGNPSIESAMLKFERRGIERIVVLPMFPQYSSTTTACIYDAVYRAASGTMSKWNTDLKRTMPALRFVAPYYDHAGYITALKTHLQSEVSALQDPPDLFVITFHGIPDRYIRTGDPYREQCERTAVMLAEAMAWRDDQWTLSFQSRFGPETWMQPYTEDVLKDLHQRGIRRPLIFAPGFVTDCLETLDELGHEGREQFAEGGGNPNRFHLAPCLNANPHFMDALADIVRCDATGWAAPEGVHDASATVETVVLRSANGQLKKRLVST